LGLGSGQMSGLLGTNVLHSLFTQLDFSLLLGFSALTKRSSATLISTLQLYDLRRLRHELNSAYG